MSIEIKFIAEDNADLLKQIREYGAAFSAWNKLITDRPKITCSEPISYQEAVDGAADSALIKEIPKCEPIAEEDEYQPHDLSKTEIRREISSLMMAGNDAKAIQKALVTEWNTELSIAAIGGMMGGIKRQKEKQEAHEEAVNAKILSMKTCDKLLIADSVNRELGGNWTEEKVARRLKELVA